MDPELHNYGYDRGSDFHACGALGVDAEGEDVGDELVIRARLAFGTRGDATLTVFEVVCMEDGQPHRRRYSYHFQYPGETSFRYERDPVNHPEMPEHRHRPDGSKEAWDRMTFHEVVEVVLDLVGQIDARLADDEEPTQ